jgi:hypothetical protein
MVTRMERKATKEAVLYTNGMLQENIVHERDYYIQNRNNEIY